MKNFLKKYLYIYFPRDVRSKKQFENIFFSVIYKLGTILVSFLMVPLSLHYLDVENYGIWLTISSLVAWLTFFDGGLGNGLKNKLSEAITINDIKRSKIIVSVAYVGITVIVGLLVFLILIFGQFLHWEFILKSRTLFIYDVKVTLVLVLILFGFRIIMDLINSILTSHQLIGKVSMINFIISLIQLISVYILTKTILTHKLIYLGLLSSLIPVLILFFFSLYFYGNRFKELIPDIRYFKYEEFKEIISLGAKFFVIQIASLIIFSTDNIIITQIFGPSYVSVYSICFKYFGIITFLWNIIISPYWIAFNEAYQKEDFQWLRKTVKFLNICWIFLSILVVFFLLISNFVFKIWIGKDVVIPMDLSIFMALFILFSTYTNIYAFFVNGVGKIKLQFYVSIYSGVINIPLTIFCAKTLKMGLNGIIFGTTLSIVLGAILVWIQTYKIINRTEYGIWSK